MTEYDLFIRECRKRIAVRGLTQMRVCIETESSPSYMNRVLSGETNISAKKMFALARFLDIDLGDIQREAAP